MFIHSPFDRHLSCFQFLTMMNTAAVNILVQSFVDMVSFLLDQSLRVELLVIGQVYVLCKTPFDSPTNDTGDFRLLHILPTFGAILLILVVLVGV